MKCGCGRVAYKYMTGSPACPRCISLENEKPKTVRQAAYKWRPETSIKLGMGKDWDMGFIKFGLKHCCTI